MKIYGQTFLVKSNVFSSNHMGVKFEELSSYYKLLFMFGDYGYDISAEMGKELDYLTKLCLEKLLM